MERAEGALFSTAETVPGASPTWSATARNVTIPGELIRGFLPFVMPRDYRRRLPYSHRHSSLTIHNAVANLRPGLGQTCDGGLFRQLAGKRVRDIPHLQ